MIQDFTLKKRIVIGTVALVVLVDIGLGIYSWRLSTSPSMSPQKLYEETTELKALKGDIERAEKIERNLPKTIQDCDKFEKSLPPAASASSAISAEVGDLAKKSGLQVQGINFHDKEIGGRSITEREMEATVSGDYQNVVKFLNSLQRSQNMYVVDSLELGTEAQTPNLVRVSLHMKTYFRTVSA